MSNSFAARGWRVYPSLSVRHPSPSGGRRSKLSALKVERLEDRHLLAPLLGGTSNWGETSTPFTRLASIPPSETGAASYLRPESFVAFQLNRARFESVVADAPLEFSPESLTNKLTLEIPAPDGALHSFEVVESPILAPELAAKFPEIKTYLGRGLTDPAASLRFDLTPHGFHAQVLSPFGTYYIDPYYHLDQSVYISYWRHDFRLDPETAALRNQWLAAMEDDVDHHGHDLVHEGEPGHVLERTGTTLRTYRAAVAATGEYTAFHGGTVAAGLAAITTAMNRVTGVYEVELTIRMQLVANNDLIVYTNAATDPYTNNNGVTMLGQNQSNLDTVIGNANYDIGHVFSTGGGGVAGLGVVGFTGQKARGVTGLPSPTGDPFYIDYVAHEMGHQFGANHTFNGTQGSCSGNRAASSAYEPGSGSTIMGYAGICGADNLQNFSDPYFHSRSLDEILSFVDFTIPGVGTRTATGNSVPTANAGLDYTVPARTPLRLVGSGSDANPEDVLTYSWEQRDLGPAQALSAPDNGSSPLFRSRTGTTSPVRILPRLSNLLNNTTPVGERLPTLSRTMRFRLTVRDNRAGQGGVQTDDAVYTVVDTGAAFLVTNPNTSSVIWTVGSTQTVTWNVSGTNASPINASNVDIYLSTDGGNTFGTLIASAVPNDGSETIVVPNLPTSTARIFVQGSGNIFFDVSNFNFQIVSDTTAPSGVASAANITTGGASPQAISVTYTDNVAIDASSLDSNDIEVVAPNLAVLSTILVSQSSMTNTTPLTGNYNLAPPGGTWDPSDNGLYTIRVVASQVRDVNGNFVPAGAMGTFTVNISGTIPGDFSGNGVLDCDDVNALTNAIATGSTNLLYDLTGDSVVDLQDLTEWVVNLKGTSFGDANLDFAVDQSDFAILFSNLFSAPTVWCTGDFNADGVTDGADFGIYNLYRTTLAARLGTGRSELQIRQPVPALTRIDVNLRTDRNVMERQTDTRNSRTVRSLDRSTEGRPVVAVPRLTWSDNAISSTAPTKHRPPLGAGQKMGAGQKTNSLAGPRPRAVDRLFADFS